MIKRDCWKSKHDNKNIFHCISLVSTLSFICKYACYFNTFASFQLKSQQVNIFLWSQIGHIQPFSCWDQDIPIPCWSLPWCRILQDSRLISLLDEIIPGQNRQDIWTCLCGNIYTNLASHMIFMLPGCLRSIFFWCFFSAQ